MVRVLLLCIPHVLPTVKQPLLHHASHPCVGHKQHLVCKRVEAALRLVGFVQHVYAAVVAAHKQVLRPYTVAGAVGGEAMQLHLHLLEETELLERKHRARGSSAWVLLLLCVLGEASPVLGWEAASHITQVLRGVCEGQSATEDGENNDFSKRSGVIWNFLVLC